MRSPEAAYPWPHAGGLSGQGPILPGEGEARPDLGSRAESAPGPWELCLSRWEGRRGSSAILNTCSTEGPEYSGLTIQLLFPGRSCSCAASIFVDPQGMFLQPFLAN